MQPGLRNATNKWQAASPLLSPPPSRYHHHHRLRAPHGWLRGELPVPRSRGAPNTSLHFSPKSGCGSEGPLRHPGFNVTLTSTHGSWGMGVGDCQLSFLESTQEMHSSFQAPKRAPISVQSGEQKTSSKAWTLRSRRRRQGIWSFSLLAGSMAGNVLPAPSQIPCSDGLV